MRRAASLLSIALVLAASPVLGQPTPERPVSVSVNAGLTFPVLGTGEQVGNGWNVGLGATIRARAGLGVRFDYLYHRFGSVESSLLVETLGAPSSIQTAGVVVTPQMHTMSVDMVYSRALPQRHASVSVFGGPSLFRQRVKVTLPGGDKLYGPLAADFCHPRWLGCFERGADWDPIIGIRKSNDMGFNVGGAFAFDAGLTAQVVVEVRYFHVSGPEFSRDGRSARKPGHYLPVTVGLRF